MVYLINILLLTIESAVLARYEHRINSKKVFCTLATIQWVLISGLRGLSVGADTRGYKTGFDLREYQSWDYLFRDFIDIMFKDGDGKDPGYAILEKAFHLISDSYQGWLMFIAILFTVSMGIWIYKNSKDPYLSFLLYSALFYAFFAITGLRQTIATAIVVFIGYKFLKERKLIKFLICMCIAYPIHKSSMVYALLYIVSFIPIDKKYIFAVVVATVLMFIFKNQVTDFLALSTGYEDYVGQYEGAGTYNFTFMYCGLFAVAAWRFKEAKLGNDNWDIEFHALLLGMMFIPLTYVRPSAMRIVQYFSVYLMLIIADIAESFEGKDKLIVHGAMIGVLTLLLIMSNPQYVFFWQE